MRLFTKYGNKIDKDMNAKVTDFAFPRKVTSPLTTHLAWCAPEIVSQYGIFTDRSDSYSFGMVLWELLTHETPFEELQNPYQLIRAVEEKEMPDIPEKTIKPYKRLVKSCWDKNMVNRPSIQNILEHLEHFLKHGKATVDILGGNQDED